MTSGACINMDRRCDQFPNCGDFSDEESIMGLVLDFLFQNNHTNKNHWRIKIFILKKYSPQANCMLVVKGDNYLPDYTPFTVDEQERLVKTGVQIKVCFIFRGIIREWTKVKICCRLNWSRFSTLMRSDRSSETNFSCSWHGEWIFAHIATHQQRHSQWKCTLMKHIDNFIKTNNTNYQNILVFL